MTEQEALTFTRELKAPPSTAYRAFTTDTGLREWLCDWAVTNTRVGGSLYMVWNTGFYALGEYTALEQNKTVTFTWQGRGQPAGSHVAVTLEPREDGCKLTLIHGGIGTGEAWDAAREAFASGWESSLENLQSVLETGFDLRITRRPMLGILLAEEIDKAGASKLGLPIDSGVRLAGTVPGMGAEAAGLQGRDVIVRIADTPIVGYQSFGGALGGRRAGDTLEVEYYRGSEKHTAHMTLSTRQLPDIPPTPAELAAAARAIFDRLEAGLQEVLTGVTDEEASHSPAEGEWSVKQVLAHLITGERFSHMQVASIVNGTEINQWPGNTTCFVDSVLAAYPTVPDLLDELRRCWIEAVALFATLPDEFLVHKGSYTRIALNLLDGPQHAETHYDQLRAAVAAARSS